jgi:hypothetical protein
MSVETGQPANPPRKKRSGTKVALIGAGVVAGAIGATALGANAATPSATSATTASSTTTSAPGRPGDPGGAKPVRSDEKSVSAANEKILRAAALKAVPGGTVVRVETDAGDAVYEVHMTKADGSQVTVKFDKNLAVTAVEDGMGKGDPAPAGDHGGHPPNR